MKNIQVTTILMCFIKECYQNLLQNDLYIVKKILPSKTNKGPGQNKQPEGEMSQNKFSD